jgi:Signal recognition particle receptor beta subunit
MVRFGQILLSNVRRYGLQRLFGFPCPVVVLSLRLRLTQLSSTLVISTHSFLFSKASTMDTGRTEVIVDADGDTLTITEEDAESSTRTEASSPADELKPKEEIVPKARQRPSSRASRTSRTKTKRWQTKVRRAVVPFLPPPVARAIVKGVDPLLAPYVGPEATVTLTVTLLALLLVTWIGTKLLLLTRSGRAVIDDEDDERNNNRVEDYDATVVLTGPKSGGKTRLFYQLCFSDANVPTLMSIKANVGIATHVNDDDKAKPKKPTLPGHCVIRYVDWPGYAPVHDSVLTSLLATKKDVRLVLVLDATQPVAPAADVLDQWLTIFHNKASSAGGKAQGKRTILIACHKMDLAKAKNDKRIKIQMRTELERIVAAQQTKDKASSSQTWCSKCSNPLELDDLPYVQLYFCSTKSEGGKGPTPELVEFCRTGKCTYEVA